MLSSISSSCSLIIALALIRPACAQSGLPTVDLGYQVHQAISFNETGQVYNFSNIRFAQPPIGDLRFAAPVAPTGRNPVVQNGSVGAICPQAIPAWSPIGAEFAAAWAEGTPFNFSAAVAALEASNASAPIPDPRTTEDCLFLDVFVPKAVFNSTEKNAAVLVWIYGGGYTFGHKSLYGSPAGIIEQSQANGSKGVIWVEMNYRLGALGWLAGPTLQEAGGVSNAGLFDQRLALEWVQKYIHLFGGDHNRVTVIGESAGGGSVMHQITAYGGQKPVSFQQAIPQSPVFLPIPNNVVQEDTAQAFLRVLGVKTIEDARKLSSESVIAANQAQIGAATYGQYIYGPTIDGFFVPALPGLLLNQGAFAKDVKVMVGHNSLEGPYFTPPYITNDTAFVGWLHIAFPDIQDAAIEYITQALYPAVYNGTYPYTSILGRTVLLLSEAFFSCNANYLGRAFANTSYAYEFSVPPGLHGWDLAYTFYDGVSGPENVSAPIAEAFQQYITSFAQTGVPTAQGHGLPAFEVYGVGANEENVNITGFTQMRDPAANLRCAWWQKALYY